MENDPLVSINILSFNRKDELRKYLFFTALLLSFSSFHFEKTLGVIGLFLYPMISFVILSLVERHLIKILQLIDKINPKKIYVLFLLLLVISFSIWYPYENIRSKGTDRDEALNQAGQEILSLKYPYYVHTFVEGKPHKLGRDNNPITVLPGSIFFALPFVILGNSAYQNFFWLTILFIFLSKYFNSYSKSLLFLILNILICGTFLFQVLIGSDYIANSIWVLIATILIIDHSKEYNLKIFLYDAFLGIGLSSRFNFLIILIPLLFYIIFVSSFKNVIMHLSSILLVFFVVTMPFIMYDYNNFTPIHFSNLFFEYDGILPYAHVIIPSIVIIIVIILSYSLKKNLYRVMTLIAMSFLIPVVFLIILFDIKEGKISFELSHYAFPSALFFSFFTFKKFIFSD